jgi:RNA polymerase sigma factor (sigma-70 family)
MDAGADTEFATRFTREVEPLLDMLTRAARRLTCCDADAEDLVQDTLLHAFVGFHHFRDGTNLKAWLFRILHNRWISNHRVRRCRPTEVHDEDAAARSSAVARSAEDAALDLLSTDEVATAVAALPENFRTAVFFADVWGLTYAETAAILDIPMGTAMSRVARGRRRLRTVLSHLAPVSRCASA